MMNRTWMHRIRMHRTQMHRTQMHHTLTMYDAAEILLGTNEQADSRSRKFVINPLSMHRNFLHNRMKSVLLQLY